MADIPINVVTVNLPPDDESGGGAAGGSFDMGPMLDVLRAMNVSVGAINQNVRSILEVLRKMSVRADRTAARGPVGPTSSRVSVERVFHVDPRKQIVPYRPQTDFAWDPSPVEEPRRRAREASGLARISARGNVPMIDGTGLVVAGDNGRFSQSRRQSDFDFFRRLASRTLTAQPTTAMTRVTSANVPQIDPTGTGGPIVPYGGGGPIVPFEGPRTPPTRPGVGPDRPRQSVIGPILTMTGRVLSVLSLLKGVVQTIMSAVKTIAMFSAGQRRELSKIDPVMATLESQATVSGIIANMRVAQDPGVRAAMTQYTAAQISYQQAIVPFRTSFAKLASRVGESVLGLGTAFGLAYEGLFGGPSSGVSNPLFTAFQLFSSYYEQRYGLGSAAQHEAFRAAIFAQITGNIKNAANAGFQTDLQTMTSGRVSFNSPYPNRPQAGPTGWWQ